MLLLSPLSSSSLSSAAAAAAAASVTATVFLGLAFRNPQEPEDLK